ncbi:hypothetical protein LTR86_009258 [Recurvomyces mirabilis]|nr:hypothetical protein LTR86_009258 [Recurvomyces mirabilis]
MRSLWRFYLDVATQAFEYQILVLSSEALEQFLLAIRSVDDAQEYERAIVSLPLRLESVLPELKRRHALAMCRDGTFVNWTRTHPREWHEYVDLLIAAVTTPHQQWMVDKDLHRWLWFEPDHAKQLLYLLADHVLKQEAGSAIPRDPEEYCSEVVVESETDVEEVEVRKNNAEEVVVTQSACYFGPLKRYGECGEGRERVSMDDLFETVLETHVEWLSTPKYCIGGHLHSLIEREENGLRTRPRSRSERD